MANIPEFDIDIFSNSGGDQPLQKTKQISEPVANTGTMPLQNSIDLPTLPGPPSSTPIGPRTQTRTAQYGMPQRTQIDNQSHYSNYNQKNDRNHATRPPISHRGRGVRGMSRQIRHTKEKIFCPRCLKDDHKLKDCVNCSHDGYMDGCPKCGTLDHQFFECHMSLKPNEEYHFTRHCRRNRPPWRLRKDHRDCRKILDGKDMSEPDDIPWTAAFSKRNINSVLPRTVVDPAWQNYDSVPMQISESQQHHIPGFSTQWSWDRTKFTTPPKKPSSLGQFRRPSNQNQEDEYDGSYYADDEVPGYIPDGTEDDTDWPSKDLVVREWTMRQEKVRKSIPRLRAQPPPSSTQAVNISIKKRGISITSGDARIQINVDGNETFESTPETETFEVARKRTSNEAALEESSRKKFRPMEDASIDVNLLNRVKDRVSLNQTRLDFMDVDSTEPSRIEPIAPRRRMPGSESIEPPRRRLPGSEDIEPIAPRRRMPGSEIIEPPRRRLPGSESIEPPRRRLPGSEDIEPIAPRRRLPGPESIEPPRRRLPGSENIELNERDRQRQPDTIKYRAGIMGDYQVYKKCIKCGSTEHLSYQPACPLHRSNQK
ncbi:hypothetical protein ACHAPF_006313 [Botrytis cinerea]